VGGREIDGRKEIPVGGRTWMERGKEMEGRKMGGRKMEGIKWKEGHGRMRENEIEGTKCNEKNGNGGK
jgi:hypothetical protein